MSFWIMSFGGVERGAVSWLTLCLVFVNSPVWFVVLFSIVDVGAE